MTYAVSSKYVPTVIDGVSKVGTYLGWCVINVQMLVLTVSNRIKIHAEKTKVTNLPVTLHYSLTFSMQKEHVISACDK